MRIIAGEKRGCRLSAPKGMDTRPTLDRVKESLFGILQFDIASKRVLDLFAGSGGLGLEALSRYAEYAVFCDSSRESIAVVKENIKKLGYENRCRVYPCDWKKAVSDMAARGEKFDIVFLDPPYGAGIAAAAAEALYEQGLLNKGFIIALEHDSELPPELSDNFEIYDRRSYGEL
ncbi:MAG: 16S rRNA (guanine(966)-N(2))-methyltransferase RsmD, partial [Clostridia bacterium]|nr:16S rRNA (guanine(966)-N(2))-methyltransferase RsmD [Clostridia bacterium]